MALIICDECGHSISDKSIFCPNCGYPTHLNKALREKSDAQASNESSPISTTASTAKIEMTDEAFEQIIAPVAEPRSDAPAPAKVASTDEVATPCSDEVATASSDADNDSKSPTESEEVDDSSIPDALAEYEATLSRPVSPEANKRNKLILYFTVLIALVAAICACYYYSKSNHLQSVDEVECEPIEEVMVEEVEPTDSVAISQSADSVNPSESAVNRDESQSQASASSAAKVSQSSGTDSAARSQQQEHVVTSPAVRQL